MAEHSNAENGLAGWRRIDMADAFNDRNGPFYSAESFDGNDDEPVRIGFRVEPHNCSFGHICHGGVLAAVLDIALGHSVQKITGASFTPTISLHIDYLRRADIGEWIESRVRILRRTRTMVFCDAVLVGPNGHVAHASGVFKLPGPGSGAA